jgi:hypothetical protein
MVQTFTARTIGERSASGTVPDEFLRACKTPGE